MSQQNNCNRMQPTHRKEQILQAAVFLAASKGYRVITGPEVAQAAECAKGLVFHYFGSIDGLRKDIMQWAISNRNAEIVLQGLACGDPLAQSAPKDVKDLAKTLLNFSE